MWSWSFADEAGVVIEPMAGFGLTFDTQQEAEQWLAENSDDLSDEGVTAVGLSDGHHSVYGPIPLQD